MGQYLDTLVEVLTSMDRKELELYVNELKLEQVKVLFAEIAPKIENIEQRQYVKYLLSLREQEINAALSSTVAIQRADAQSETIDDNLKSIYDKYVVLKLSALSEDEKLRRCYIEQQKRQKILWRKG